MDDRALFLRIMRKEFGNLLNSARIKIVTIASVDLPNNAAVVDFAQGETTDPITDQQTVQFLESYFPQVGENAYLLIAEGASILIGAVEKSPWVNLTLPTGYATIAPFRAPAYRIDNTGRVWFKGACNVGASNAIGTKFTMPVGYRALTKTFIAVPVSNGTTIVSHMRYDVNTDGTIDTLVVTSAIVQIFSFEGVSYDTR